MKFEKETRKENVFEPITISITIETREEFRAIDEMCCQDISIPELVRDKHSQLVDDFLVGVRKLIHK